MVSVVAVVLLEEAAAVVPRVALVGRLVAMELVFSDMRERNDKKRSRMKGEIGGPLRKRQSETSGPRDLKNWGWSHVERGAKENCETLARRCDPLVVNGKKKLDGRFSNGGCVRACDERWRQPSILGSLFQTPPVS